MPGGCLRPGAQRLCQALTLWWVLVTSCLQVVIFAQLGINEAGGLFPGIHFCLGSLHPSSAIPVSPSQSGRCNGPENRKKVQSSPKAMLVKIEDREQLRMLADLAEDWSSVTNTLVGRLRIPHLSLQLRGIQCPLLASSDTCIHAAYTHHIYRSFYHHFLKELRQSQT